MLLIIDGGPSFWPSSSAGYESLERKRCAVAENQKGEIAGKKHAVSASFVGQSRTRQGSDEWAEMYRKLGVSEQAFYRWPSEYGGFKLDQARRLQERGRETGRWTARRIRACDVFEASPGLGEADRRDHPRVRPNGQN